MKRSQMQHIFALIGPLLHAINSFLAIDAFEYDFLLKLIPPISLDVLLNSHSKILDI